MLPIDHTFNAPPLTDEQRAEVIRLLPYWEREAQLSLRSRLRAEASDARRRALHTGDERERERLRVQAETFTRALELAKVCWPALGLGSHKAE